MQITKFLHSCLLVEDSGKTFLIDPGNYSSEVLDLNSVSNLDYILITHEHGDHMHIPLIKQILEKFPEVSIITNPSAATILEAEGIKALVEPIPGVVEFEDAPHEKVFMGPAQPNISFTVNNLLTHPGDSFHFTKTAKILALPVQAPWGSVTEAVDLATKLKPEIIVPIHDWHWRDEARIAMYQRLTDYFEKLGIKFLSPQTGEKITI